MRRQLLGAVVFALAAAACSDATQGPATALTPVKVEDPAAEVTTALAKRGEIATRLTAPGSLWPKRESRIGAEVTGRIERVFVSVGDRVKAGDPLFQIDRTSYAAALAQAEAGLDLARAQRAQYEGDVERGRTMREKDFLSQQQLDRMKTQLAVAHAQEKQAAQAVEIARRNLEKTLSRAPYDGSIADRLADEGTTALNMPQTIVVVIQETDRLEARVSIPETQLALVAIGDRAQLFVEGLGEPVETTVFAVSDSIDPATRTYLVRMDVPNADHRLKAGVFARVELAPRPRTGVVLVPLEAVRMEDGETRVFVVQAGVAVPVTVKIGITSGDSAEVLSGLDEGAEVIVGDSARTIAPGMRVRTKPARGARA
jgi:RND family efflux transporter MFP subunit